MTTKPKYKALFAKYVDASDAAQNKMLDILCSQMALYDQCEAEIAKLGICVETKATIKMNPALVAQKSAGELIAKYLKMLQLDGQPEVEELDVIKAVIGGNVA